MITLKIEGMTCGHCTSAVEQALARVSGVVEVVEVNLERGEARIAGGANPDQLIAAIKEEGFAAQLA